MKKHAFLFAALVVAGSANAQTADSGVYVGVEGAYVSVNSIEQPTGGRKTSETTDVGALRALVGYQFNKNLALELGYFATGDFKQSGVATNGSATTYETKLDAKGADLAVVYKFTEFVPGLFVKAGATHTKVSGSFIARNGNLSASDKGSVSGTGYLLGLGYEFGLTSNLGARVAYTRYERLGGETDNKANMFSLGLKYKF